MRKKCKEFVEEHKVEVAIVVSSVVTAMLVKRHYESTHIEVKTLNAYLLKKFVEAGGNFSDGAGHYHYPQFYPR